MRKSSSRQLFNRLKVYICKNICQSLAKWLPCQLCHVNNSLQAMGVCQSCYLDLPWHTGAKCRCCQQSLAAGDAEAFCGSCLGEEPLIKQVNSVFRYEHPIVSMIKSFKYKKNFVIGKTLAALLLQYTQRHSWPAAEQALLVPVPLHEAKLRARGFNHAAVLAKALTAWPISQDASICQRVKATAPQFGLSKRARAKNMAAAFKVTRSVRGKNIILLDDIVTTLATANACAKAFYQAGAKQVQILALARA